MVWWCSGFSHVVVVVGLSCFLCESLVVCWRRLVVAAVAAAAVAVACPPPHPGVQWSAAQHHRPGGQGSGEDGAIASCMATHG